MKRFLQALIPIILSCLFLAALAHGAESPDEKPQIQGLALPTQPIMDLLRKVENQSGKRFLLVGDIPAEIVTGTANIEDLDYPTLLLILSNNGLGAVPIGRFTNIVPVPAIRMYDLPLLLDDDASLDDMEWVTRIVTLEHASVEEFVPVVRPLVIRAGHLAAIKQSNSILIVERYGNARRIARMLRKLDEVASRQE